ncbi:MAG: RDD family protein [Deltaproteobacteria bacterium]|nr:RDD family protein [Deltaproteobacteria bacterium]
MFLVLERPAAGVAKVSVLTRCIAKGIDLCVIILPAVILPYPVGVLLGFMYTLVHDGVHKGQSLGKWLFQLKVMNLKTDEPCTLRESVIRNAPLGVATFFAIIPLWGWVILILLGIPLVALEVYLMLTLANGGRLGDVMADTCVVEAPRAPKAKLR